MSRIFDFKKRFGQEVNIDDLKKDFINKISHFLMEELDGKIGSFYSDRTKSIFDFVAMEFSCNPSNLIQKYNSNSFGPTLSRPTFSIFSGNDFEKTLLLIEVFYDYFRRSDDYEKEFWIEEIDKTVLLALSQPISLGISWRNGRFYPEGVKEFDEKLISDVLIWLENKPKIKALYQNALDHYSKSINDPIKRKDVFSNAFQAVEKLTKEFLETSTNAFDNNFNALIKKLDLHKEWSKIFNSYKELSKEFGRHGGNNDNFIPEQADTEAFLYLSGLIMRLILQKIL
jgi:hypothetical protein